MRWTKCDTFHTHSHITLFADDIVLLADDIVLLAESAEDLQRLIDIVYTLNLHTIIKYF